MISALYYNEPEPPRYDWCEMCQEWIDVLNGPALEPRPDCCPTCKWCPECVEKWDREQAEEN
jgi:hypothetical protein